MEPDWQLMRRTFRHSGWSQRSGTMEDQMSPDELRIIKLHKRWADRLTVLWLVFSLVLLTGFHFVLDQIGTEAPERAGIMVLLAVIVLIAAIWQAVGLGVARVHLIIKGINLER
jgi:hypothetical protein